MRTFRAYGLVSTVRVTNEGSLVWPACMSYGVNTTPAGIATTLRLAVKLLPGGRQSDRRTSACVPISEVGAGAVAELALDEDAQGDSGSAIAHARHGLRFSRLTCLFRRHTAWTVASLSNCFMLNAMERKHR